MCTVSCKNDGQCPGGTACVATEGGICAVRCEGEGSCAKFGEGWACRERDRQGGDGNVSVCWGD
jgi:hypothetical protein